MAQLLLNPKPASFSSSSSSSHFAQLALGEHSTLTSSSGEAAGRLHTSTSSRKKTC